MSSSAVDSSSTIPLRKRMNILERAHSHSQSMASSNSFSTGLNTYGKEREKSTSPSDRSPTEYESPSEEESSAASGSSDEVTIPKSIRKKATEAQRRRPRVDTTPRASYKGSWQSKSPIPTPDSPATKAWYEFDLAVVVALVSPIGNWLTGGDHIKNLLLIVLLIFYLHQIIEIPWSLYNASRSRRRPSHLPQPPPDHQRQLLETELRNLELFFLFLTSVSPFLGAILLRYATTSVIGTDAVSWFSTGLFVLATGMRPWSHLVERLRDRTKALHDAIHYAPQSPAERAEEEVRREMEELKRRMERLEGKMGKVKEKMRVSTDDVFDYIDEAVQEVEKSVMMLERRGEGRWREVEEAVKKAKEKERHRGLPVLWIPQGRRGMVGALLEYILPAWLYSPANRNIYNNNVAYTTGATPTPSSPFPHNSHHSHPHHKRQSPPTSPSATFHSPLTSDWSTVTTKGGGLETIAEEDGHTHGAATLHMKKTGTVIVNGSTLSDRVKDEVQETVMHLYALVSRAIWWMGWVATMPLRAAVRLVLKSY